MTSGGIKRFGGFGDLTDAKLSSPGLDAFELLVGTVRFGNKTLVRLMELSGIRGGFMEACNDFEGDRSRDLVALVERQYAVE